MGAPSTRSRDLGRVLVIHGCRGLGRGGERNEVRLGDPWSTPGRSRGGRGVIPSRTLVSIPSLFAVLARRLGLLLPFWGSAEVGQIYG